MHVLHMATEVPALRESLATLRATEWSQAGVLSEVVSQVAALFEDAVASLELANEVHFNSLSLLVLHLDCFVPFVRDPGKCFNVALVQTIWLDRHMRAFFLLRQWLALHRNVWGLSEDGIGGVLFLDDRFGNLRGGLDQRI